MDGLLTLGQCLSPAFPMAAFAYSHGLETVIAGGDLPDAAALERWLCDLLQHGSVRQDAVLLCLALGGADMAATARALAGSRGRLGEKEAQGAALAATLTGLGVATAAAPYPVVLGQAARRLALPRALVAALFVQAVVGNLVTIAVRAVPLGQTERQRVLAGLGPAIAAAARFAAGATEDDLGTAALGSDMAAMRHETLQPRLFLS